MSLYYDAASILSSTELDGSLKSRIYSKNANFKSKPAHLYALISETAKYDTFLKEVIENAGILSLEPKLTPLLALLTIHDHLFAKRGIAAASSHPLRQTVERHKGRLQSELTKARLRRRIPNIDQLKEYLLRERGHVSREQPRWARFNTVKRSSSSVLNESLAGYEHVRSLEDIINSVKPKKVVYHDQHIPNLLAFAPDDDLTKSMFYTNGGLILQDKASCFPAYLLFGDEASRDVGDCIDGCAAPGNKTTHMAAILSESDYHGRIFACERDPTRSTTLKMMVEKAGAQGTVEVLAKQDFLALENTDPRFANVTHLLLDPSCSGSGIMRREDIPKLALPLDPKRKDLAPTNKPAAGSKKRKRDPSEHRSREVTKSTSAGLDDPGAEAQPLAVDHPRLQKLSNLQSLIVEHAFSFPAAKRVTYSTCSIHAEENEAVVERVLKSSVAKSRGWRVLTRDQQVDGLKRWKHRGLAAFDAGEDSRVGHSLSEEESEACIRCSPDDGEGTMGFFVCGFVRDVDSADDRIGDHHDQKEDHSKDDDEQDAWEGFEDN